MLLTTPFYHPCANSTERYNEELKVKLKLQVGINHTQWDTKLVDALFCLRQWVNTITGEMPAKLEQGRKLPRPWEEQRHEAARWHQEHHLYNIALMTNRRLAGLRTQDIGTPTLRRVKNFCVGLAPRWIGPYTVQRKLGCSTYVIRREDGRQIKVHHGVLKIVDIRPYEPMPAEDCKLQTPETTPLTPRREPEEKKRAPLSTPWMDLDRVFSCLFLPTPNIMTERDNGSRVEELKKDLVENTRVPDKRLLGTRHVPSR
ncbi:hypothetical protein PR048_012770 [Dryococelus australis]|uniref:Integrase catalytic domain-containing protein n=1 Tax=Dryococelus australis TaxID=614101 RepID=A0ABQ9HQA0_9NEOP|nr:hypothetical protein PR048_012770 [Dryococelus australis]